MRNNCRFKIGNKEQLTKLWLTVVEWRDRHEVSCAEALVQVDSVNEDLSTLAENVLNIVGYK